MCVKYVSCMVLSVLTGNDGHNLTKDLMEKITSMKWLDILQKIII